MRIVIVSRIFAPEVSAASGLLRTWAEEFRDRGHEVVVLTSRPPRGMVIDDPLGVDVRRAAVKRDRQQYVRGYLSYLSYDIPLAFRLLFSRKADLYVVEPPPTTVAVVRVVARLRRTPYVVDAADLWGDAAAMVTDSRFVLGALRRVERWALNGARHLFAAHEPLIERFREVGIVTPATAIGFGADTAEFRFSEDLSADPAPLFVYAGTHSEWHGAGIFIEAFATIASQLPTARLLFVGNGEERDALRARAQVLGLHDAVEFRTPIPPAELNRVLAKAVVSLASLRPGQGYDYAFTTKVYSSLSAGCPVIFSGVGPTAPFLRATENPDVGVAVDYDVTAVAQAMLEAALHPLASTAREKLASWASERYSLTNVARTVVDASLAVSGRPQPHRRIDRAQPPAHQEHE